MKESALLSGIVSGALCLVLGFAGGTLLTRSTRGKTGYKIAAIKAETETALQTEQEKTLLAIRQKQKAEAEVIQLKKQFQKTINTPPLIKRESSNEETYEKWLLCVQDKNNLQDILFKLRFIAIQNDTIDTKGYHNHINHLNQNHKLRLETIGFYEQNGWLKDADIFEKFTQSQEMSRQMKLEKLKNGDIYSFDLVEQSEMQFYEDLKKSGIEHLEQK